MASSKGVREVLTKEKSSPKDNNHIHRLFRVNLQTCINCGRFFVTTCTRTKDGELVLTESELDLKVKTSRDSLYQATIGHASSYLHEHDAQVEVEEETCW